MSTELVRECWLPIMRSGEVIAVIEQLQDQLLRMLHGPAVGDAA
jgi:hypothetical protein